MAAASARNLLLNHLRVRVNNIISPSLSTTTLFGRRFFSEEVKGSFLDKSEVADRVVTVVKNFQKVDPSKADLPQELTSTGRFGTSMSALCHLKEHFKYKVNPDAHFQKDLGLDSLDTVEVVMALEEEFGFEIPDNEADKISSINLAVDFIASHPQAK